MEKLNLDKFKDNKLRNLKNVEGGGTYYSSLSGDQGWDVQNFDGSYDMHSHWGGFPRNTHESY